MTQLLERAFQVAAKLSPDEQDVVANWLLAEMSDEQRWLLFRTRHCGRLELCHNSIHALRLWLLAQACMAQYRDIVTLRPSFANGQ